MLGRIATTPLTEADRAAVIRECASALAGRFPELAVRARVLDAGDERERARVQLAAQELVRAALDRRAAVAMPAEVDALVRAVVSQVFGLGWLEALLDQAARGEITEVMLNPDGSVWVIPRGETYPVRVPIAPSVEEAQIVIDKLLAVVGRRMTEAEPIVSARIPRSPRLPSGARVHVVAPPIANGDYPALNVRFYEQRPVTREQIVDRWRAMSPEIADMLEGAVRAKLRIVIAGGTGSGKTTLLSYLAGTIPSEQRIVLVEDPSEIYVDHPHVVSLEARPATAEGKYEVSIGQLVTAAMRMTPRWWLIVGEIRRGDAAMWLFRAQMSDHPGLSTIHADSAEAMVATFATLLALDLRVDRASAADLFSRAVDIAVQVGFDPFGRRRVLEVNEVVRAEGERVIFRPLARYDGAGSTADEPRWAMLGEITRARR